MTEFKSPYSSIDNRKFNTWCRYTKRIDTYGCGCQHDCSYCYAKSLLNFRGLWDNHAPRVSNLQKIRKAIQALPFGEVVKLGGMTDCFQPLELTERITYSTILLLNRSRVNYLIVTKSDLVAREEYLDIYDKDLAHFQISITNTSDQDCLAYEKAPSPSKRIKAIEKLYMLGFDVSVRLSPLIEGYVDFKILNDINCNKILVEFLKVNHWVKKWFDIDYSNYSHSYGGYNHLNLEDKLEALNCIWGFKELSVGEYVSDHHVYFRDKVNYNKEDCCNLRIKEQPNFRGEQLKLCF